MSGRRLIGKGKNHIQSSVIPAMADAALGGSHMPAIDFQRPSAIDTTAEQTYVFSFKPQRLGFSLPRVRSSVRLLLRRYR